VSLRAYPESVTYRQDAQVQVFRSDLEDNGEFEPGVFTEATGQSPGEYVFLRHYVHAVTAIVGSCSISLSSFDHEPAELIEPALEIGRTVGCSAYKDDFVPPVWPAEWGQTSWGVGPGFPGFSPGMSTDD
jgi:hypothetical protein